MLKIDSSYEVAHYNKSIIYYDTNEEEKGIVSFNKAVTLNPFIKTYKFGLLFDGMIRNPDKIKLKNSDNILEYTEENTT